ncbi:serine/threonine protein kinase [Actinoallomurus spadix]|uniref:non-specific serine/threonine protein kinase n=1 Tax=Actinoallomurus spadix TaxID=79912 RepID=A0ABN0XMH3_9ACTN|nr:serine/threonine-protein kinase [Actinoallomurus spadix]MCO5985190.1 serine/threonine protein kinase [Actinoallomurus spadix]
MRNTVGQRPGQVLSGRYRLDAAIGGLGAGADEAWRGFDLRLNRVVTVKVFAEPAVTDQAGVAAFRSQAEKAAAVRHPAVEAVLDIGTAETPVFLVTEHLDGQNLKTVLAAQGGGLPIGQVTRVAEQALDALTAAHAQSVVHGALTSADLVLLDSGDVKLCNLGIGVPRTDTSDARTDLHALGRVLHELLTGVPPAESSPVPPASRRSDVPPYLDRLVLDLLAEDPAARPQSAAAALAVLRESMESALHPTAHWRSADSAGPDSTVNDSVPTGAAKKSDRGRLLAEIAGAVVLVAAAAAGGYLVHGGTAAKTPSRPAAVTSTPGTAAPAPPGAGPKSPPLVPGWQVVVAPDFGVVYDVPPGWKVEDPGTGVGLTDASGNVAVGSNGVADISRDGPHYTSCTIVQSGLLGGEGITSAASGQLESLQVTAAHNALQWANFGYQLRGVLPRTVAASPEHPTIGGLRAVLQKVVVTTKGGRGTACEPNGGTLYAATFASRQGAPVTFYVFSNSTGPGAVNDKTLRQIIDTIRPLA